MGTSTLDHELMDADHKSQARSTGPTGESVFHRFRQIYQSYGTSRRNDTISVFAKISVPCEFQGRRMG